MREATVRRRLRRPYNRHRPGVTNDEGFVHAFTSSGDALAAARNEGDEPQSAMSLGAVDLLVLLALAACGWGLWAWAASQTDAEAWDHDSYWSVVLPAMLLVSAIAGWLRPGVARLVGVALVVPQAITLFATSGFGALAVVGLFFFIVFALFFTGVAQVVARLRERRSAAKRPWARERSVT